MRGNINKVAMETAQSEDALSLKNKVPGIIQSHHSTVDSEGTMFYTLPNGLICTIDKEGNFNLIRSGFTKMESDIEPTVTQIIGKEGLVLSGNLNVPEEQKALEERVESIFRVTREAARKAIIKIQRVDGKIDNYHG